MEKLEAAACQTADVGSLPQCVGASSQHMDMLVGDICFCQLCYLKHLPVRHTPNNDSEVGGWLTRLQRHQMG